MKNIIKKISSAILISITVNISYGQTINLTLEKALSLAAQTKDYEIFVADSIIQRYNERLFDIKILPKLDLTSTIPNLNHNITTVTQNDGSDKFLNRFYSNFSVGLILSQLIPFTGGNISMESQLNRLDNYNPNRTTSYSFNLLNFNYQQNISSYNDYKWSQTLEYASREIKRIRLLQDRESIYCDIVDLFFDLYLEQRNVELNKTLLELSAFVFERSKILYEQNRLSEEDYLEAKIEYCSSLNQSTDIYKNETQKIISSYFQFPTESEITAVFDPLIIPDYSFNFDIINIIDRALYYNKNLSYNFSQLQRERRYKELKSQAGPTVNLSAGTGFNSQAERFSYINDKINNRINVVVSLSVPILHWKENKIKRNIISEETRIARLEYEHTIEKLSAEYTRELNYIQNLQNEIINTANLIELITRRIELIKVNLEFGIVDMDKLINIRSQLIQNEISYHRKIKQLFTIIHKYRFLALIDIRENIIL